MDIEDTKGIGACWGQVGAKLGAGWCIEADIKNFGLVYCKSERFYLLAVLELAAFIE